MKINHFLISALSLLFLMSFTEGFKAQQAILPAGNNAQSTTGSVSYSMGQLTNQSLETASGKVNQGVQQPYEIFALSTNDNEIQKKITVYPNPVKDFLIVDFSLEKTENVRYQLFDASGKLIFRGELKNLKNEINTSTLSSGMYMLSILSGDQKIKTFKIIKNN